MIKITKQQKLAIHAGAAGSAWMISFGLSVGIGVLTSLVETILNYAIPEPEKQSNAHAQNKKDTYVRLSPYPLRSSVGVWI